MPVLAWVFHAGGFPIGSIMHLAVGTSLATIVVTSLSSVRAHHRRGAVRWGVFAGLTPGLVLGALAGAGVADYLASDSLRTLFGIFELLVAAHLAWGGNPPPHHDLPGRSMQAFVGMLIGAISALMGIGGGTMTAPFLIWCNVNVRQAVATSAAAGLPIALAGAAGFVLTGLDAPLPGWNIGYIYLPAFAGIILTSIFFAPLGARFAHAMPTKVLRRVFAFFLVIVGLKMLSG